MKSFRERKCEREDIEALHRLLKELAIVEKNAGSVKLSPADYLRDGFDTKPLLFLAAFAEAQEGGQWRHVGLLVWCYTYSAREGRSLGIQDRTSGALR